MVLPFFMAGATQGAHAEHLGGDRMWAVSLIVTGLLTVAL